MDRIYLDYNATSPLSPSVKEMLRGDVFFANPSSQHSSGKLAQKFVRENREFFQEYFQTDKEIFFHSGATEGATTVIQGCEIENFVYFKGDHACIQNQQTLLTKKGIRTVGVELNEDGCFPLEKLDQALGSLKGKSLVNMTWVHNETGVIWDADDLLKLKQKYNFLSHIDAAQAPGKVEDLKLNPEIDFYTFSSHKFGGLKGHGFTFRNSSVPLTPLLYGGGQQGGIRSGTINVLGSQAARAALEDLKDVDFAQKQDLKDQVETCLANCLGEKGMVVGAKTKRNNNTVCFIHFSESADILLASFDMNGLEVSTGSACSSGSAKPSETLVSMGLKEYATNGIRISLPVQKVELDKNDLLLRLKKSLQNFC
jgi:cysteine desulfurase